MRNKQKVFLFIVLLLTMATCVLVLSACGDDDEIGTSALPDLPMPKHPYLNNEGYAGAHADSYNSGVQSPAGPLGIWPIIHSQLLSEDEMVGCSTQAFDSKGRIITVGASNTTGGQLVLLDPDDLTILAKEDLPTVSGYYTRLDNQGRIIIPCGDKTIRIYETLESAEGPVFYLANSYDLSSEVPEELNNSLSFPLDVVPDWQGNLWYGIVSPSMIGYIDPATGEGGSMLLPDEQIENGVCASQNGVYVLTNQYLYGLRAQPGMDEPEVFMKFEYDKGSGITALSSGSGTAPVIFGGGNLIAFGDNADSRKNVLVYRLDDVEDSERLVCKIPVFPPGDSALENSFIGYGNSLVVENNYGFYLSTDYSESAPGIVRIDVREDLSGCDVVWENDSITSGCGAKLSTGNGLIYQYALEPGNDGMLDWYFTAIDFETGELNFKVYTGSGDDWDNMMFTLSVGPNGLLTAGLYRGIASLRDGM